MLGEASRSSEAAELPKAELWNGYSLLGMPTAAMPPSDAKGQHSYTVRLNDSELDVDISIDVLMRCRAFFVKKPTEKKTAVYMGEVWQHCRGLGSLLESCQVVQAGESIEVTQTDHWMDDFCMADARHPYDFACKLQMLSRSIDGRTSFPCLEDR